MLPSDLTVLAYHTVGGELAAFVLRDGAVRVVRNLSQTPVIAAHLAALENEWQRFQAGPAFIQRHMERLTRSTQQVLQTLHGALIDPRRWLVGRQLPAGDYPARRAAPFAFFGAFRWPVLPGRSFEIVLAPSTTVLSLCAQRPLRPPQQAVVFGVDDPLIPFARHEAALVGQHLPAARLRMGEEASLASLHADAAGCHLLHLACHGLFRRDNPMFSALKLHDGWLTAGDVLKLKLPGAFVTLSACELGRSQVVGGDEPLGLPYAFLGAGALGLLVSLWLVDDETDGRVDGFFLSAVGRRRQPCRRSAPRPTGPEVQPPAPVLLGALRFDRAPLIAEIQYFTIFVSRQDAKTAKGRKP